MHFNMFIWHVQNLIYLFSSISDFKRKLFFQLKILKNFFRGFFNLLLLSLLAPKKMTWEGKITTLET